MKLIKNELMKEINIYKILVTIVILFLLSFWVITYSYGGKSADPTYRNQLSFATGILNITESDYAQNPTSDNLKKVYVERLNLELEQVANKKHILIGSWEDIALQTLSKEHAELANLQLLGEGVAPESFNGGSLYSVYSEKDITDKYTALIQSRKHMLDIVSNKEYYDYVSNEINDINEDTKKTQELIDADNESYSGSGKSVLDYNEALVKIKQFIVDNKILSNQDVTAKNAKRLENLMNNKYLGQAILLSEDEYNSDYDLKMSYHSYKNYERFILGLKSKIDKTEKKLWYAMEHRIVLDSTTNDMMNRCFSLFIIITISIIIMLGGILSNEYKTGTIKLLLTKGVKRSKIIMSKYVTVIMCTYALILIFLLIFTGITLYYLDFHDLLAPELVMLGGNVIEVNYFIYIIVYSFFASIPCIFFITLTFFLSILITNSIASTGITVFLATVAAMFTSFFMDIAIKFNLNFIKYTPLPYLDISQWFGRGDEWFYNIWIYVFDIKLGIVILLSSIIVMYICTHIIFIKKDVRN